MNFFQGLGRTIIFSSTESISSKKKIHYGVHENM